MNKKEIVELIEAVVETCGECIDHHIVNEPYIDIPKHTMESLVEFVESKSNTDNSHHITLNISEPTGQSSALIKQLANGETRFEIKVYSNDIDGADKAFAKAKSLAVGV